MWPVVALAALQGGMGYLQAKQQQKQQMAQNLAAAEQTRQSPWTGMGPGEIKTGAGSPLLAGVGGGLSGGLSGYMMGKNIEATDKANALNERLGNAEAMKLEAEAAKMQSDNPWMAMQKPKPMLMGRQYDEMSRMSFGG